MPASFLPFFLLAPAVEGWLGIWLADREEAVVTEIVDGSPAQKAGLMVGDVLLAVDDEATPTRDAFVRAIQRRKVGERVVVKLQREGRERSVTVQLERRPEELPAPTTSTGARPERPAAPHAETRGAAPAARGFLGLSVRDADRGVVVDRAIEDGPAAAAGVRTGDVVIGVDDRRIETLQDLDAALRDAPVGRKIALTLRSESGTRSVTVTLGRHPDAARAPAVAPIEPAPHGEAHGRERQPPTSRQQELEAEIASLRAEIAELRRQVEALRRAQPGRQE